jgi:membrane protein implicated in regulation of membrane protease activity
VVWWLWVVFGMVLLVAELSTPGGLFFLFFGLAATVVGSLAGTGVVAEPWLQWWLFSGLAIVALVILRGPLRARLNLKGSTRPVDSIVGQTALAMEDIAPGAVGKVELRGASWNARSTSGGALSRGQRTIVDKVDGLMLWVRPE